MPISWAALRRGTIGSVAALGLLGAAAGPASAETFVYVFKGLDAAGAQQSYVSGYDDAVATRTVVLRGGSIVDRTPPAFELLAGDVVQVLNNATGAVLTSATFDGAPTLDATTCVGAATFAGTRTSSATVSSVVAFRRTRETFPYAYDRDSDVIRGQVATLSGTSFGGTFARAIPDGHIVSASQTLVLSPTATLDQTIERRASACPPPPPVVPPPPPPPPPPVVPPPPPPPPADTTLPSGKLTLPAFLRKSALISIKGLTLKVNISEPGTARVDIYVDNTAKLPALKSAATKKTKPKLMRLAGGQKSTTKAGDVKVTVKTTTAGRKLIKSKKRTKARVVTTLTDAAGNRKRLPVRKTTIR